ncbi:hypothetical protein ABZZ79_31840 [Streptomyces sp. NPDC006458]|uniref:hypothetical protein n=1 Tax=Streptomyces sp. NPDC006458 TaxID=3154302 RepID=UPI0033BF36E1
MAKPDAVFIYIGIRAEPDRERAVHLSGRSGRTSQRRRRAWLIGWTTARRVRPRQISGTASVGVITLKTHEVVARGEHSE